MRLFPAAAVGVTLSTALLPATVFAQSQDSPGAQWGLGVGGSVRTGIYAGESDHYRVIPLLNYEGQHVYLRGTSLGYHLLKRAHFRVDGFVSARLDGVDPKDFGVDELAAHGIDRALLSKRRDSADAGAAVTWLTDLGRLKLSFKADITGTSDGYESDLSYEYPLPIGRWVIEPELGVTALSKQTANYYYGTLDKEVARGVPQYRPGAALVPHIGITARTRFWSNWNLIASVEYRALPGDVQDSPLLDANTHGYAQVILGIAHSF
ncbi:MipA/OmpV family protein [Solimonas marina]|uniref:MipA/OmpV family protein n=1 Tax=Solimonas marina TaxID=2714601 RepID=A0A970B360_9GAMM|nr:MipA/OmpV family protein [Solimonas marina]NKF20887.1 MipA/OmpV family protein [Solimonas marina]